MSFSLKEIISDCEQLRSIISLSSANNIYLLLWESKEKNNFSFRLAVARIIEKQKNSETAATSYTGVVLFPTEFNEIFKTFDDHISGIIFKSEIQQRSIRLLYHPTSIYELTSVTGQLWQNIFLTAYEFETIIKIKDNIITKINKLNEIKIDGEYSTAEKIILFLD